MNRLAFAVLTLLVIIPGTGSASDISGIPRIVDGDTLVVGGKRIRFNGIDTPETKQPCTLAGVWFDCGKLSSDALRSIINGRAVRCVVIKRDRYKRYVAKCYVGSLDIQSEMTRQGWAFAYRKYSVDYANDEVSARRAKLGLWQYELMKPWNFRKTSKFRKRFKR
jgi:endonuclease YncB( thermonuclease family)